MQDLEHDMDDLFRRAAERYPLKTGDGKWNDLVSELEVNPNIGNVSNTKKNTRGKVWVMLFLLSALIAGGILIKYNMLRHEDHVNSFRKFVRENANKENEEINKNPVTIYEPQHRQTQSNSWNNIVLTENKKGVGSNNKSSLKPGLTYYVNENFENNREKDSKLLIEKKYLSIGSIDIPQKNIQHKLILAVDSASTMTILVTEDKSEKDKMTDVVKNNDHVQSSNVKLMKARRGIYLGMVLGPSFSEVKYQGLGKSGFDIGVIAGYKLNKNISIESGLLFAKKYYFSDGKYFNMDKVRSSMPAGMKMVSLNGSNTMFEIPVTVKYDFVQKGRSNLFAAAGISSFILTKENNDYVAIISGSVQNLRGNYQNTSKYFTAAINFSAGYEYKITKQTTMRIEPYMKIPLKGFGVGSLPVFSAGLHVGISLPLH